MQCLFDADILKYECGFGAESAWKHLHSDASPLWLYENPPPWEMVQKKLEGLIAHCEETCNATEPSIMFFTGANNFRFDLAKTQPYKPRMESKPYHHKNIEAFLKGNYVFRQVEGLEADDLLGIYQSNGAGKTIICSRDKDLRQLSGYLYSWECNKQPSFGPFNITGYGRLELSANRKKLTGYGLKFFLSQCILGDRIDGVLGLPDHGVVAAFDVLGDTKTYMEGLEAVREAYKPFGGDDYLLEQAQLLWMVRELNEDGSPVMWNMETNYEE